MLRYPNLQYVTGEMVIAEIIFSRLIQFNKREDTDLAFGTRGCRVTVIGVQNRGRAVITLQG